MNVKLNALVMMQLKDKIDMSFLSSTKKTISKIVLSIVALAVVTAVIYVLFLLAKMLNIFSLVGIIPTSVVVVIFTVMMILSILTCTYSLMKNLYFAKDNQVLLTLPVSTNALFASKIIVYYLYELIKNLYFLFPLFFAYGLISGMPIYYYLWMPVCIIIISALPVCIGALLSIFAMFIALFLRNFSVIKWIIFAGLVAFGIYIVVSLINLIPENLDIVGSWGTMFWDIQDFLNNFTQIFYPFTMLVSMVVGYMSGLVHVIFSLNTFITLLILIGTIALCLALSFIISKPLFCKMAAKPFEYKKKIIDEQKKNKARKPFASMVRIDNMVLARTAEDAYSLLGVAICMPILILLLNSLYAAMSTRLLGDMMIVSANLLVISLIALASNNRIASIFSKEGAASYLIKTRPVNYHKSLIAKVISSAIVIIIAIIATVAVFKSFNGLSAFDTVLFGLTIIFMYISHMLWSAEMDVMNPQSAQYATTGTHVSNPNETKSSIAMFGMAFLFFGISLFLSIENPNTVWIKVSLVALAFMVYRIWSFYNKVKYFYKDK